MSDRLDADAALQVQTDLLFEVVEGRVDEYRRLQAKNLAETHVAVMDEVRALRDLLREALPIVRDMGLQEHPKGGPRRINKDLCRRIAQAIHQPMEPQ